MQTDILIIGAGVVGCALARDLSRYTAGITVLEAAADVAEGASKANSGIVHAGFDAHAGSVKAHYNVRGAEMYPSYCAELGVPYRQNGALVLAFSPEDRSTIEALYRQGLDNGVKGLRILERDEILTLEPLTNAQVVCALLAETSGLVSPYELTFALADHAAVNGVQFQLDTPVTAVRREDSGWTVATPRGEWHCRILINCAGASSAWIHNQMTGREEHHIVNRRGQYWILDHASPLPFRHTMFQCPTKMGKGVLVAPTVHGNVLLGPTAEDIDDPLDTATTAQGLDDVLQACRLTWPQVNVRTAVTNFSGIRAHEEKGDFIIGAVQGCKHAYETVGVESPGLTSAPAIAAELSALIAAAEELAKKDSWVQAKPLPKPFNEMTPQEQAAACAQDPLNGRLICRCEVVTEAEIRRAIRRPVGARSIDGVKRRTRAGMGRCQGGFCAPRVAEILSEELQLPMTQLTKNGGDSLLVTSTLVQAMKEAQTK